jgi:hypothetical protein
LSAIDNIAAGNWPDPNDPAIAAAFVTLDAGGSNPATGSTTVTDASGFPVAGDGGFLQLPGVAGIIQTAANDLEIVYDIVQIVDAILLGLDAIPFVDIVSLLVQLILNLLPFFAGRPRYQATLTCAHNLLLSKNAAGQVAGNNILALFNNFNIVISESGPGAQLVAGIVAQLVANLEAQGIATLRARAITLFQFQQGAQTANTIAPELTVRAPTSLQIGGPKGLEDLFTTVQQDYVAKGDTPNQAWAKSLRLVLQHAPMRWLWKLRLQQPTTTGGGQGNGGGQGGNGGGGGGNGNPPPVPPVSQPDPDGDEITDDLCAQMAANTTATIAAINNLASSLADDPACCASVVTAINAVATGISTLVMLAPAPVDLTAVVAALNAIAAAIATPAPINVAIDTTPIADALAPLAKAISSSPATDVSGIVQQLANLVAQGDVDQSIIDAMVAAGLLNSSDAQTLQGIKWSDMLSYVTGSAPVRAVEHAIKAVGADAGAATSELAGLVGAGATWVEQKVAAGLTLERNVILDVLKPILESVLSAVTPASTPAIGSAGVDGDTVVADIATVMLNMKLLAMLLSLLREGAGEQLEKISESVLGLLGFEELREVQLAPLITNGLAKVADMNAKALFMQDIPGVGQVANLVARRLMDPSQAAALFGYNGLHTALQPIVQAAAYRGFNARQMLRLIETDLFTQGDILDELNFAGMRQVSQQRMLTAAPWLATASQRNQLKAAFENQYTNGLFSDADLAQKLDELNQNTDGNAMTVQRVQIEKLIAFAKKLEAAYSKQFIAGLISVAQFQSNLEGLGLQPDWINNALAVNMADLAAAQYKKQIAEELAIERSTAAEERKAAVKNFTSGNTDEAGLLAALILSGLNAAQAAAWTDLASLQKAGGLRLTYGLELSPNAAALLRQRVTALVDQRKSGLIQDPGLVAALAALGLAPSYINSIVAAADATIKANTAAVFLNVETGS